MAFMSHSSTATMTARIHSVSLLLIVTSLAISPPSAHAQSASSSLPPQISECPCARYTPWDSLSDTERTSAETVGYDSDTWDWLDFATARVETKRWSALTVAKQTAAMGLGYDQRTWDCCINHYEGYGWVGLAQEIPAMSAAVQELGYTRSNWDAGGSKTKTPLVEVKTWCANVTSAEENLCLTNAEVENVRILCYSPSEYRNEPMSGRGLVGGGGTRFVGPDHCYRQ